MEQLKPLGVGRSSCVDRAISLSKRLEMRLAREFGGSVENLSEDYGEFLSVLEVEMPFGKLECSASLAPY